MFLSLLAVSAMLLTGCSSTSTATTTTTAPAEATTEAATGKEVKVGVSIYKFDDNFMTLYRNEIENYFGTLKDGNTYNVTIQDGKGDQAEQTCAQTTADRTWTCQGDRD